MVIKKSVYVKRIVAATGALGEKNEGKIGHWFEVENGADRDEDVEGPS